MKKLTLLLTSLLSVLTTSVFSQNKNDIRMEQRITYITLGVEDLKTSMDFYENKFGWERSEASNEFFVTYQLKGLHLALYSREELAKDATVDPAGNGFKGLTMAYNVWSEKEVDDLIQLLRDKGVTVVKEPQKVFWGGYSSYVSDPDGYLWEIAFNPYLKKD